MPRCRVVEPLTTTLAISDGDTLVVKRQLNAGETRAAFARMAVAGIDGARRVDSMEVGRSLMVAYLVDWSMVDPRGHVIPIRDQPPEAISAALESFDSDTFAEIREAIEAHDAAVRAARDQEKNGRGGENGSSAISPSPVSVTGDTSGSAS